MVYSCGSEAVDGPAILQLQKWDSAQFDVSEFCEAFISPTRDLLLLLSHQCEASLLPLFTGKNNTNDLGFSSECLQGSGSFCSSLSAAPHRSDSLDNLPSTSGSVEDVFIPPVESTPTGCKRYPIIYGVKSLAWGHCGDAYEQHKDTGFKELLFVSGDHGITVHGFCHLDKSTQNMPEHVVGQGRWVEWGPETVQNTQSCLYEKTTGNIWHVNGNTETKGTSHDVTIGTDGELYSGNFSSKKWLRSFLTNVENIESEGNFWSKFPVKSSYPCSAEVVSFRIFDNTALLLDFLIRSDRSNIKKKLNAETVLLESPGDGPVHSKSNSLYTIDSTEEGPKVCNKETGSSLKCSKVFSSTSHRLVGFVLIFVDPILDSDCSGNVNTTNQVFVVVTMIYQGGLQWISSKKLQDVSLNPTTVFEWTDFQFSDNLLLCLHASGLIFVNDANTSEPVGCLDILQICGLNPKPNLLNQEELRSANVHNQHDKIRYKAGHGTKDTRRVFKKLMVGSSSFLAAVDEDSVIYVICPGDYYSEKSSTNTLVPHLQNFGIGMLIGWEVGGLQIGCQNPLSGLSSYHSVNISSRVQRQQKSFIQGRGGKSVSNLSGFSVASPNNNEVVHSSEMMPSPLRKIFLPVEGCRKDDFICFSPFGITRLIKKRNLNNEKDFKIVHMNLHVALEVHDDRGVNSQSTKFSSLDKEGTFIGEAVGCSFQGCLYLVTQDGFSVVLPSVSISSNGIPVESFSYWRPSSSTASGHQIDLTTYKDKVHWPLWKLEVLDRVLLYEGPEAADHLCSINGWDLKTARLRHLQLALDYLKVDEIQKSLESIGEINIAEEGILRILLTAVYQLFCKVGNDNEVALASRLLDLAASFATRVIRKYGLLRYESGMSMFQMITDSKINSAPPAFSNKEASEMNYSRRLHEMAHFLEIIRTMQCRLDAKNRWPAQVLVDDRDTLNMVDAKFSLDESCIPGYSLDAFPSDTERQRQLAPPASDSNNEGTEKLALIPIGSSESPTQLNLENHSELSIFSSQGDSDVKSMIPLENPKDMIARWEIEKLDLKTVVKDALHSGRLPLAVLQLHIQRVRDLVSEEEHHDIFTEIRDVGRTIAYDLFLKGETGLAISTLQRLGEDIEISLKQLLFGTVRRSLRVQVAAEMQSCEYLASNEWKILERIALIERLYPSCNFWGSFHSQQEKLSNFRSRTALPEEDNLQLMCSHSGKDYIIECGEIDGAVIGPWENIGESSSINVVEEDTMHFGYWAAAAVWSDAWDQKTIDRIVLDQPFHMGVHVSWESQLEYYMCRNDWEEVFKLLDVIPSSLLSNGSLQVNLDGLHSAAVDGFTKRYRGYQNYVCSAGELDSVCMNISNIKILKFSSSNMCNTWLRVFMEQELARKNIFLKGFFECTTEIIQLLSHAGFIINKSKASIPDESSKNLPDSGSSDPDGEYQKDTLQAFHKVFIHHCAQYDLPHLLDLYLDHHELVLENGSLNLLLEAAGDREWAKWLLLSRVKGHEYDASFSNARSVISHNSVSSSNLRDLEIDEIICTVDDMAEGGGELAALATLLHAPAPIQKCLCSGSVIRHFSSSSQCTLENLRPGLQRFPTLWRTLVAACFGQDVNGSSLGPNAKNVFGDSALSDYLNWRENIFTSAGHDTSLVQMLPCWFSKPIRRLIQLFVQGPFGWQSLAEVSTGEYFLHKDMENFINTHENAGVSAISWEAAIQKRVEEELYASALEEAGFGVEHHLHRGRALAAFNHLLGVRIKNLRAGNTYQKQSNASVHGKTNVQADVQMLLAPVTQSEESLLSSVMPLAIVNFEEPVLVASCAFLLELCGLSASMLRVDIAALRRISSFYVSNEYDEHMKHLSPKSFHAVPHEGDITVSLARALADDYLHKDSGSILGNGMPRNAATNKQPSRPLLAVLQHLEKVSLPSMVDGKTCGSWLFNGSGDGTEIRFLQKTASQHWSLVTSFCQMHQMPLSTKYLALLAKDNDWVGFLTEAQVGGYSSDVIVHVASEEFSDPRLKIHILTVLKSMCSTRRKVNSSLSLTSMGKGDEMDFSTENNFIIPVELFGLLAECEKQQNPGEALLVRAKDLRWSLLAIIASCFPDITSLACLTVWLEITAARETSSIKVNDIASQIANNVGAAVEATNALSAGSRSPEFHYNRKNAKRRCLIESTSGNFTVPIPSTVSTTSGLSGMSVSHDITSEEGKWKQADEEVKVLNDPDEGLVSLSKMVRVLCEQRLFLPLLRAFEMFLPSCSLLPFIRALQAFSQMRLSEASAHLASFSVRIKDEPLQLKTNISREGKLGSLWIGSTAVAAADAMLSTCPSAYEKRCLLQLLSATDYGDGGSAATCFRRLYWKVNLAEPSLRKDDHLYLGNEPLDDASLLSALEKHGHWDQARNWARQLEATGGLWKSAVHHVTETQAEAMVAEWKEFLWDVPEERAALWTHCQKLFLRYSFPALQAGLFFLNHAEAVEKDVSAKELHEMLLLSLQWLSGIITQSNPVYPLHLLREIETRVWLLAVESEAQVETVGAFTLNNYSQNLTSGSTSNIIERTASNITKMDNHLNARRSRPLEKSDIKESNLTHPYNLQVLDTSPSATAVNSTKTKRRAKSYLHSKKLIAEVVDKSSDPDEGPTSPINFNTEFFKSTLPQEENVKAEASVSRWEERVGPEELERAVLSLLEFGQVTAAKQLQHKLSPEHVPSEFLLVDVALKLAAISTPACSELSISMLDADVLSVIQSYNVSSESYGDPLQVLESLAIRCTENGGQGLCKRIIAVVKAANVLGLSFAEAFGKRPLELLQLLSLKAQDSFEEAKSIVQTHSMPPANIAQILAESFLKGLLAAHRGGYMDFQKEEGPAPLLWRISDFLKWAELCPSEPEIGHALMRLVITGQEVPHACEVELLILAHHFYKSSACLDGVDVLVALAATRVECYVSEGDFTCLARLVTGVSNFHALNFILGILIENGQLDLLLQKYSAADSATGTAEAVRGFRMAVLTSLKHFNPHDFDACALVYNHFDMKHETAALLESQAMQCIDQWFLRYDKEQNEDLLEAMHYFIKAAEVHTTIDTGNKTRRVCAQAFLLSLQIRMPDFDWLNLSMTNARRALVEQSRFQEALIVADAYNLNQPSEWALVLWNQMLKPELTEQFVAEFVAVLPLQPSMLADVAKFYRAEVAARGDQTNFSVWLSPGGLPAEWLKHLARSFRCLLKRTRDIRLRLQLATVATGFTDVVEACLKALDRVPDTAGPLVLRKGHGGAYLPLM
ncbi:Spatacsin [Thalictrum thalictroides]|uniref:Spatacsin n=1 Tax=Thalictrum thalictroides TaxID=46969 RepID=A0A7J6X8C6_THATH|nr:Spatacsin [Thalictrum thalictroides]